MDSFIDWLITCAFIGWSTDITISVGVCKCQPSTLNQNILATFDFFQFWSVRHDITVVFVRLQVICYNFWCYSQIWLEGLSVLTFFGTTCVGLFLNVLFFIQEVVPTDSIFSSMTIYTVAIERSTWRIIKYNLQS